MITTLLTHRSRALSAFTVAAAAMVVLTATSAHAAVITSVTAGSKVQLGPLGGSSSTLSFNAGATADALVVALSSESNASAGQFSITYAGFAFTPVIDHTGAQPSIWLLNLSGTTYSSGAANLVVNMTAVTVVNGIGLGVVSVNAGGKDLDVHAFNTSLAKTVSVTTTAIDSFVVAGHRANSASGSASTTSPLTQLFGAQIGSSQGAGGWDAGVGPGTTVYTFTSANSVAYNSSAAAFIIAPTPAALPAGLAMLGLAAMRRRRMT